MYSQVFLLQSFPVKIKRPKRLSVIRYLSDLHVYLRFRSIRSSGPYLPVNLHVHIKSVASLLLNDQGGATKSFEAL